MKRRDFLKSSGFLTASVATFGLQGCMGGGTSTKNEHKFPQGIASADPRPDSIVLWVRCVPFAEDDVRTSSASDISVTLRVTTAATAVGEGASLAGDSVAETTLTAMQRWDHTIRHKLSGLAAGTTYYYQFSVAGSKSSVGRFKTAPATSASPGQLKFALLSCQDWSVNHWGTLTDLVASEADLDFFLHVGDYIYETVGKAFQSGAVEARHGQLIFPNGTASADGSSYATSTDDYRYLYKRYRSDPRLQALHERYAMIAVWDDHEFSDDCWGDAETYSNGSFNPATGAGDNTHQTARRRSANQAWFEHMPAEVTFDDSVAGFQTIKIYRDFQFGTLAHLIMTDQRLYRSDHIVPEAVPNPANGQPLGDIGARYFVPEPLLYDQLEAAKMAAAGGSLALVSILGATQREWWKTKMKAATATWKLWGSELMLLKQGLNGTDAIATLLALQAAATVGPQVAFGVIKPDIQAKGINSTYIPADKKAALAPYFTRFVINADGWDGFDAERRDLMSHLKLNGITNVVALTGDIHAFYAGEVRDDYRAENGGMAVMTEIVTAGVSSDSFFSYLKSAVGSLSSDLAPLVFYNVTVPVPQLGNITFSIDLLDYTLGKAAPNLDGLKAQTRHAVRTALAKAGAPESLLESTTDQLLAGIAADPSFNTQLLGLAQALASLNSNPWLKHVDTDAQGYTIVTVTPAETKAEFRKVHRQVGLSAPTAVVATRTTVRVAAGTAAVSVG